MPDCTLPVAVLALLLAGAVVYVVAAVCALLAVVYAAAGVVRGIRRRRAVRRDVDHLVT